MVGASGYASLIGAGANLAQAFMHDTTDAYNAAFNTSYAKATARRNSWEQQHKGELSIAAARIRSVKTRTAIGLKQDVAEAQIRVNAAAAGVRGDVIEQSIYQTKANAANRIADRSIKEANEIDKALAEVYAGAQGSKIPTDTYDTSIMGSIFAGLSSLDSSFMTDLGLAIEESEQPEPYKMGTSESAVGKGGTIGLGGR